MNNLPRPLGSSLLVAVAAGAVGTAMAAPPSRDSSLQWSYSLTPIYQWDAKLDQGGEFSSERLLLHLQAEKRFGPRIGAGLGLQYGYEDYDFDGVTGFGGARWNTLNRFSLSLPFSYRTESPWQLLFSPSLEISAESGAEIDDSLGYGAVAAAVRRIGADLSLGFGLGAFRRIEKSSYFPFIAVRWQITDRLRLANPFRAGPSGPAGLELALDMGNGWELAAGGAYRSYRFRLDKDGAVPGGIGETEQVPVFLRASKRLRAALRLDLYIGAALAGKLTLEDGDRRELAKDDFDTTPFVGVALAGEF